MNANEIEMEFLKIESDLRVLAIEVDLFLADLQSLSASLG